MGGQEWANCRYKCAHHIAPFITDNGAFKGTELMTRFNLTFWTVDSCQFRAGATSYFPKLKLANRGTPRKLGLLFDFGGFPVFCCLLGLVWHCELPPTKSEKVKKIPLVASYYKILSFKMGLLQCERPNNINNSNLSGWFQSYPFMVTDMPTGWLPSSCWWLFLAPIGCGRSQPCKTSSTWTVYKV